MQAQHYPPDTGSFATLSVEEKKKRLDAMVQLWQKDTGRRLEREGYREFIKITRGSFLCPLREMGSSIVLKKKEKLCLILAYKK